MTIGLRVSWLLLVILAASVPAGAQDLTSQTVDPPSRQTTPAPVLIPLSGQFVWPSGQPRTGPMRVRLAIYEQQIGGEPVWFEFQDVMLSDEGRYSAVLGAASQGGVPAAVFAVRGARWVGVTPDGEVETLRGELQAHPYAVKAMTSDALAGAPAEEYVRTDQVVARVMAALQLLKKDDTTQTGGSLLNAFTSSTPNTVAKFIDGDGTIGDSAIVEVNGRVGIGPASPSYRLDLSGDIRLTGNHAGGNLIHFNPTGAGEQWELYPDTAGFSVFNRTDSASRLYIDNTGNVGVGTAAPLHALHVRGTFGLRRIDGAVQDWVVYHAADNSLRLNFNGAGSDEVVIDAAGNTAVGGTLQVSGATTLSGSLAVTGNVTATGSIAAKYQDVAEWVEAVEPLPPGTVVAADPASVNKVRRSQRAYDSSVLGVVSAQPGVLLGDAGEGRVAVAQSGRVLVKVDASNGAIRPGDLLVASPTPGVAMRSKPGKGGVHRPGTIIGKALQGLTTGTGEILVLITLQ